jgi:hypothetical protein
MPRTTVNLDASVLREPKRLQKRERKPLGRLISERLAQVLRAYRSMGSRDLRFTWITRPMHARVDLADKGAVQAALGTVKTPVA